MVGELQLKPGSKTLEMKFRYRSKKLPLRDIDVSL